jgi:G3E family GTPase
MTDRIALTILGGYLGSGKTTWLRHQLHIGACPHVIINEAAEMPVDDLLLAGANGLTVLAGGCACCTGLPELIDTLRDLCDQRSAGKPLAEIMLETSGLADPGAIAAAMQSDPVLIHHIRLTRIIVLVDAVNGLAQLASDPLGRAQISAADQLILTKTDSPDLAQVQATLRHLNPTAPLSATDYGVPVALPPVPAGTTVLTRYSQSGPNITATKLTLPAIDWAALSLWLSALLHVHGDRLVRVKGTVQTPAGRLLIQAVRRTVQPPEVLPDHVADNALVFIGHGVSQTQLAVSLARFSP